MLKYLIALMWTACLAISCSPKPSPQGQSRSLGHPRSEVLTNPEIQAADERAHLFSASSVPANLDSEGATTTNTSKPETLPFATTYPKQETSQILTETGGNSIKEVYGFAVKSVKGIKCLDAPFDLAN